MNSFPDTTVRGGRCKELPKCPTLDTVSTQTPMKRSKLGKLNMQDKHILDLRRVVKALQEAGRGHGVPDSLGLISCMPPQMGWLHGSLCSPHKRSLLQELNRYAPNTCSNGIPTDDCCPDLCVIDMAITIHSVPPRARQEENADAIQNRAMGGVLRSRHGAFYRE